MSLQELKAHIIGRVENEQTEELLHRLAVLLDEAQTPNNDFILTEAMLASVKRGDEQLKRGDVLPLDQVMNRLDNRIATLGAGK